MRTRLAQQLWNKNVPSTIAEEKTQHSVTTMNTKGRTVMNMTPLWLWGEEETRPSTILPFL